MLRCLLVARKENLTGVSTGLTGRSKNLDPTGNPTGRSTRPVSISEAVQTRFRRNFNFNTYSGKSQVFYGIVTFKPMELQIKLARNQKIYMVERN